MPSKVWDEITYPFPKFNCANDVITCFGMDDVIIYAGINVNPS